MTTLVKILNEGPSLIKIEVQGRDENGRFVEVAEDVAKVGQFANVYIHQGQSFQVTELKEED